MKEELRLELLFDFHGVSRRFRRRLHQAGNDASAWRTSFRAPTLGGGPNEQVTAP